jgi:CBS domain-containing protein
MARYERDYGRDYGGREFGYRRQQGPPYGGGMRSDGWGGNQDWQSFAGEEGWPGSGYSGYDTEYREGRRDFGRAGPGGPYGGSELGGDFRGGYGGDFRSHGAPGARQREGGYRGRDTGYMEGWENRYGSGRGRGGLFSQARERLRAADIMTDDPQVVTPDATITDVARKMRDLDVGIIPVVDADSRRLRGVITDRDIAIRAVAEGKAGNSKVSECMTDRVRHVNKNDSIQDVMRVMRQEQVRRVPVTDREGRIVGIIAQADLAVDYAAEDTDREMEVGEVLEYISEPARPRRESSRMAAGSRKEGDQGEANT